MSTPFRFSEHRPDPRLSRWVLNYWEFEVGEGAPPTHHVPPDGCTSLLIALQSGATPVLLTSGPWTTPLVVPAVAGQRTRGVRLTPGAAPYLLGVEAERLVNRVAPLAGKPLIPIAEIIGALQSTDTKVMVDRLNDLLVGVADQLPETDPLVAEGIRLLWLSGGTMAPPAVAEQVGCSPRTLLRHVRRSTGLTPKQFARIVRFHSAARVMAGDGATLSQAAAEGGYADQPHFHHEVTALTGLTPAQLAERVRRTDHRQR